MLNFAIRAARTEDVPVLHTMIGELAQFLNYEHVFLATPANIRQYLFDEPIAQCLIAELSESNAQIGYAIYYRTLSTFRGKPGIHLEDIYVRDGFRDKKIGRGLMREICQIAEDTGCGRVQWEAPIDNERAKKFYNSLDVPTVGGWVTYRLTNGIKDFSSSQPCYKREDTVTKRKLSRRKK